MRCTLIRRPDDPRGLEISVELRPGTDQADVIRPGRMTAALERLASSPWTRAHGYGYLRTPDETLKIEALEFDEASDRVRSITVSRLHARAKGTS